MIDSPTPSKSIDAGRDFLAWSVATSSAGKRPRVAKDLFVSAKTATAIPVRDPARRAALIQASLDDRVLSIAHIASTQAGSALVNLDAVVLQRDDGRFLLDIVPTRPIRPPDEQQSADMTLAELGLTPMVLTAEDIIRQPRYGNTQMVWAQRETPVPLGLRMRALQTLLDVNRRGVRKPIGAVTLCFFSNQRGQPQVPIHNGGQCSLSIHTLDAACDNKAPGALRCWANTASRSTTGCGVLW